MCNIYNKIGSLETLKSHLEENKIYDFKSLKEVLYFKNSYPSFQRHLISNHEKLIEEEKNILYADLQQVDLIIDIHKQQAEQKLIFEIDKLKFLLNIFKNG
jgi:hypothetical protein